VKGIFTDEFILDESPKRYTIYEAIKLQAEMRDKAAERERFALTVEKWGEEERERANARLRAMAKSDNPEAEMKVVNSLLRQIENQSRVETIIAKILKGK
jgi:hypothetical protein